MRFLDLVLLIFQNLGRRKARVALTAVGVVIGTAAVVILVSLAIGLQRNAQQQLVGIGDLTLISVSPNYGEFVPEGSAGAKGGSQPSNQTIITNQALDDFAALPGVDRDGFIRPGRIGDQGSNGRNQIEQGESGCRGACCPKFL
jgi:putative ABC transport system permease protein